MPACLLLKGVIRAVMCPGLSRTIAVILSFFLLLNLSQKKEKKRKRVRAREARGWSRAGSPRMMIVRLRLPMGFQGKASQIYATSLSTTGLVCLVSGA